MSDVCQVDGLITRPEESYRLWCAVFDQETSRMGRAWPALGRNAIGKKYICYDANYASYPDENLQAAWKYQKLLTVEKQYLKELHRKHLHPGLWGANETMTQVFMK